MKKLIFLLFLTKLVFAQPIQNGAIADLSLLDFSGGINVTDFPSNLSDKEALLIQNLVFKQNILKARPGSAQYNPTPLGGVRPRGLYRAGNKKLYLAYNGFLYKGSGSPETTFVKLADSLTNTLKSDEYVSFIDYAETTNFVDGRNYWKTIGDSLIRGNVVDEGLVTLLPQLPDTIQYYTLTFRHPYGNVTGNHINRSQADVRFVGLNPTSVGAGIS